MPHGSWGCAGTLPRGIPATQGILQIAFLASGEWRGGLRQIFVPLGLMPHTKTRISCGYVKAGPGGATHPALDCPFLARQGLPGVSNISTGRSLPPGSC